MEVTEQDLSFAKRWKRSIARVVRWSIMQRLMVVGIRTVVPRHRIGVAVVAVDEDNRILMLKHVYHAYVPWDLPGGWLDRGEAPGRGALRELHEETGLSARLGPVLHVSRQAYPDSINMAFLAYDVQGTIQLSSEILDACWYAPERLPSPMHPFTRDAIRAATDRRTRPLQPVKVGAV